MYRRLLFLFIFVFFLASMPFSAEAGPLNIKVTRVEAGDSFGDKQAIIFWCDVKNTSQVEYISRISSFDVEVTGFFHGDRESYKRKVNVDWTFEPALGPHQHKNLRIQFMRKIGKNMPVYREAKIKVLRYNFKRAS